MAPGRPSLLPAPPPPTPSPCNRSRVCPGRRAERARRVGQRHPPHTADGLIHSSRQQRSPSCLSACARNWMQLIELVQTSRRKRSFVRAGLERATPGSPAPPHTRVQPAHTPPPLFHRRPKSPRAPPRVRRRNTASVWPCCGPRRRAAGPWSGEGGLSARESGRSAKRSRPLRGETSLHPQQILRRGPVACRGEGGQPPNLPLRGGCAGDRRRRSSRGETPPVEGGLQQRWRAACTSSGTPRWTTW